MNILFYWNILFHNVTFHDSGTAAPSPFNRSQCMEVYWMIKDLREQNKFSLQVNIWECTGFVRAELDLCARKDTIVSITGYLSMQ